MDRKKVVLATAFIFNLFVQFVWAGGNDELSQLKEEFKMMQQKMQTMQGKIEQLETGRTQDKTEQAQVKQQLTQVKETVEKRGLNLEDKLSWHGYFSWNFEEETRRGANPSFDAFALALIPKFTLSDKIDIYSQIIFEHAPFYEISVSGTGGRTLDTRSSGELTLNDTYLTYNFDERLKFRAGKFATPFGLWNTLMYASPTYVTIKQPGRDTFYSRGSSTATDGNIYARYGMGAWFLGNYDIFSYDLYVINGRTLLSQHKDDTRDKGVGVRLGAELNPMSSKLKLFYSYYQDKFRAQAAEKFAKQFTHALSSEFSLGKFKLFSEFADSKRDGIPVNEFYALAQYNLSERLIPFAQYQYDEPNREASRNIVRYYSGGLAFQILPWRTILKIQADRVNNQNPLSQDYNRYLLGISAAF